MAAALHDARAGRLPAWAEVGEERRAHIERVAALMEHWAAALGLDAAERSRWRAAAWLHDALRDADGAALRPLVPPPLQALPDHLLHGPAVARRLEDEGVDDAALLLAVGYHTIGHPAMDRLGRALYLADFLEPGRTFLRNARAAMRDRMPDHENDVLVEVIRARLGHLLEEGSAVRPETLAFWNAAVERRTRAQTA